MKIVVLGGDGKLLERPPQSGEQTLVLPAPFGELKFIHSQHSEVATVPFAKGSKDKGIKEFTWRLHLADAEHGVLKPLVKAGFGDFDEHNDPATSMSASIGAQNLGRKQIPPGAWSPEECLDIKHFFAAMKKRHFRITMQTTEEEI